MSQETNEELEFKKLRLEVNKMIIDIEHDVSQREHWKRQNWYWWTTVVIAVIAITFAAGTQIYLQNKEIQHKEKLANNKINQLNIDTKTELDKIFKGQ